MMKARIFLALFAVMGMTAAMAQDGVLVPNRLATAKIGEWASYKLPDGYIQKLTVAGREGSGELAMVTVRIENIYDGEVVTAHEITQEAGEALTEPRIPEEQGVTVSVRRDTAEAAGKSWPATIVQIDRNRGEDDDGSVEWWVTADIPVFGIIQKVDEGRVMWVLDSWGDA